MSSYKDIDEAVEIFKKENCDFELMHCVAKYPLAEHASLNLIKEMMIGIIVMLVIVVMKKAVLLYP